MPIPSVFSSAIWHREDGFADPQDGEAGEYYDQTRWDDGVPWIDRPPPNHFCGRPEAWMGASGLVDLPLLFTPLGWCLDCGDDLPPVHVRGAGIGFSGQTPIPAEKCAFGIGGGLNVNAALAMHGLTVPATAVGFGPVSLPSGTGMGHAASIHTDSGTAEMVTEGDELPIDGLAAEMVTEGDELPIDGEGGEMIAEGDE